MAAVISSMSLVIVDQQRRKTAIALTAETAAKEKAEAREAETMAVLEFVESHVFAAARPEGKEGGQGSEVSLRKAVKSALPFVANSFMDQPLIEARLRLSLGMSFYYLGDAKTAAEQFEAARAIRAKLLGSDHLDTLQCISSLANSYYALGRHAEALQLREETLALQKTKLGPDHHHTLMSMGNLAVSYSAFGRHADALKLHVETLELMKAKLGPEHDDTLGSMHNVAMSYAALGRHADAIKLQEQTLAVQKVKLGLNHYDTLLNMNNLANSYGAVGRHADALKLHEETLALMKRNLGGDHPATLVSMDNLADSYTALGRHADALKLCTDMLELQKVKLGLDHPDTLMSMWSLAEKLVRLDRGAEAVPVIDECVQRTRGQVVDTSLLPGVMDLRLRHFEKTKDAARCRQTAEMLEKLNGADAGSLYAAACFRAVTAAVLKLTPGANATRLANEQADRAMAWLKQAVAAGYKDTDHMKQDTDLDALRGREDFKKLLAELEAGTKK
jgi:tetratricopeptide (TPR) repeat protein